MILERFIISRFLSYLFILFFGLTGLYLLIEAFESLPDFLDAGVNAFNIITYFFLISLGIIYELSPLIILLAGLLTLVTMGKSRELMALRSIGVSTWRISRPILAGALILATIFTSMKLFIVPEADKAAGLIMSRQMGKDSKHGIVGEEGRLYYRGKNSILTAQILTPDASVLADLEWLFFSPTYKLTRLLAASEARYDNGRWIFFDGVEERGGKARFFKKYPLAIDLYPQDLVAVETPVEEASASQLWKAMVRLRELSLPYYQQEAALLGQLFYSFLGVSLLYACLPLVFFRVQGGAALGLVFGTGTGFLVWAIWNMLISMGKTGAIPPVAAVMAPHLLLVGAGLFARKIYRF